MPDPTLASVEILTTQRDFLKASSKEIVNATPGFLATPGTLGQIVNDKVEWVYEPDVAKRICTPDAFRHVEQLVELANRDVGDSGPQTVESATKLLKEAGIQDTACYTPTDLTIAEPEKIVKYRFKRAVIARSWATAVVYTAAILGGVAVVAANFYYRGVVFVICGPRRRRESSGPHSV